jgi:NAD(P)-dependent dehydrogenase (short-subunit alcohol dehydrogenase family)
MTRTIVLITGANQGIGFEVAKQILKSHRTYYILLGSRDPERGAKAAAELDPAGTSVEPITIDVTDDASVERAAEQVASKHGRLDVLINNAGINNEIDIALARMKREKEGITEEPNISLAELRKLYREAYDVNVFGAAAVTEAFIPLLEKAVTLPPRIVFVSSHTGSMGIRSDPSQEMYPQQHKPRGPVYRSSKAALNMLMLHYAALFEDKGGKVNASCPNLTATNFARGMGRPVSESAVNIVRLATLAEDGETGTYSDEYGPVPW